MKKQGDYTQVEMSRHAPLEPCPCCGSDARCWRYNETSERSTLAVMCNNGDPLGPQEDSGGITSTGCVLYMPPPEFYRDRIKSAVEYWNSYSKALNSARRSNNWKRARTLRQAGSLQAQGDKQ